MFLDIIIVKLQRIVYSDYTRDYLHENTYIILKIQYTLSFNLYDNQTVYYLKASHS